jgi:hypothetical protein
MDIALRVLILVVIGAVVAVPFWRATRKPMKYDKNNFESETGHLENSYSSLSHNEGGDAGGHH